MEMAAELSSPRFTWHTSLPIPQTGTPQQTIIEDLPDDCICKIIEFSIPCPIAIEREFRLLVNSTLVSHRWEKLVNSKVKMSIDFSKVYHQKKMPMKAIEHKIKKYHNLRSLDLSTCDQLSNEAIIALASNPNLHSLSLGDCKKLSDEAIIPFASKHNLRYLDLYFCTHISYKAKQQVLDSNPQLMNI